MTGITLPPTTSSARADSAGDERLVVAGLEAIIDATAGILAAQSLEATLQAMADALAPIVPYTSLVVYEVDWTERVCVPLLATGSYLEQTLNSRPPLDDSATGAAVLSGELVYRGPDDPVLTHVMPGTPVNEVESILVAPLRVGERVQGTLNVWREATDTEFAEDVIFTPAEMILIERFASLAAIAYANSSQREQLRTQALTDELTGLANRRHCEAVLRAALEDGRRHGEPTSIAYFDIDAFKSINDAFGHGAGDEALRRFAEVLQGNTRAGDLVCRTGGEEFTVILPRTDATQARGLAERINAAVRTARLGPQADLTVSAGVATAEDSLDDFDRLVQRADAALLRAKRVGRDRVVVAEPGSRRPGPRGADAGHRWVSGPRGVGARRRRARVEARRWTSRSGLTSPVPGATSASAASRPRWPSSSTATRSRSRPQLRAGPGRAPEREGELAARLAEKYGMSVEQARALPAAADRDGRRRGAGLSLRPRPQRQHVRRPPHDRSWRASTGWAR